MDNEKSLALHFGMSGELKYFKHLDDEPNYSQMLINFVNGYHLAYIAPRKLGKIQLVDNVEALIAEKGLGPDVLDDNFDYQTFQSLLAQRQGMIKSALMDQQLIAGIGNIYSDEILFQVGLHPRTKVQTLGQDDLEALYHALHKVLRTVVERRAKVRHYPDDYLTPERGPHGQCPRCGRPLERVKVSGRSAYYCPKRQGQAPSA